MNSASPPDDPYDCVPYASAPIEWTAPERLATVSRLHGGPRPRTREYRVLELGCANGANLLALAYFRRDCRFVGIDGAASQIAEAKRRAAALALTNVEFLHREFTAIEALPHEPFDYVIAHGIVSWVPERARDALLRICATRLHDHGLVYLNYNARPGWNIRGIIRDVLRQQVASIERLDTRAEKARSLALEFHEVLVNAESSYSQLLAGEFDLVARAHPSYVAHEYLAEDNHAYWRSEFLGLAASFDLRFVGDADFNYDHARIQPEAEAWLRPRSDGGRAYEDMLDVLCHRQLHSPIFAGKSGSFEPLTAEEFAGFHVGSPNVEDPVRADPPWSFRHPTGFEVTVTTPAMRAGLTRLAERWPSTARVDEVFDDVAEAEEDLRLLHRHGLLELLVTPPRDADVDPEPLHRLEREWGGYQTSALHRRTS